MLGFPGSVRFSSVQSLSRVLLLCDPMNRSTPGLPGGTLVKNLPANAGDTGSISGSERSPGGGNGNPFQYCLENPMDRAAWQATYSLWCRKESTEPEMVFGPLRPAVPQFATRWQDDTLLTTAPPKPGKSKPAQTAQQSRPNKPAAGGSLPPPAARKGPLFFPHRRQGTHLQGSQVKNLPAKQETWEMQVRFLAQEDSLEEEMATHSSILVWRISWTEEPNGLQSIRSQRIRQDSDCA